MEDTNHTFAICAYKESPYLQECIDSLKAQSVKTNIIMATSTPCDFITGIAKKNDIPLYVNEGEGGITQDWNFAYSKAKTDYVTIAHQDDTYKRDYVKNMLAYTAKAKKPLIFFTDYSEIRNGMEVKSNVLLVVKRNLLFFLRFRKCWSLKFARWFALAFGSGICCPSVTMYKPNLPDVVFAGRFQSNVDWEAWSRLYKKDGDFVYCSKILISHRIHEESETSKIIADGKRSYEDYKIFCMFWQRPVAAALTKIYSVGQKSNQI